MCALANSLPPILPVGTAVVLRVDSRGPGGDLIAPAGAVGVVIAAPADAGGADRLRFPGGEEILAGRDQLEVLKHYQRHAASDAPPLLDLSNYVIYRCVVGSRAYGLERDASDVDRRGIYLPSADLHWSLAGVPEQLENDAAQECYWELQKFLTLALKANPNVLEVLYSPLVELATPLAQELLDMRQSFLSKLVYQTYSGYVLSQFKKLEGDIRNHETVKWKHAMHLIRLLLAGIEILRGGEVRLQVKEHRERLLAIRDGMLPWVEVNHWRLQLQREFEAAFARTTLPDWPDHAAANAFLLRARRSMV